MIVSIMGDNQVTKNPVAERHVTLVIQAQSLDFAAGIEKCPAKKQELRHKANALWRKVNRLPER